MQPFQPKLIVVPTDFSEPAAHALRYASALADRFSSHLLVIYADPFIPPINFSGTAVNAFSQYADEMIEETRERLEIHAADGCGDRGAQFCAGPSRFSQRAPCRSSAT